MSIYSAAITFILVMDPLGNIPLFLSILAKVEMQRRKWIILRESLIAFVILAVFLLFGQYILDDMHISQPALSISGGIILFIIAIRMIFPQGEASHTREGPDPFIVPLAIPLIAGPSTMTMVMLFAKQAPDQTGKWLIALILACFVTTTLLLFANSLRKLLGERGLIAIERLMGMILTTMAVQMFLTGFQQFLQI